jgi:hypothetical protein
MRVMMRNSFPFIEPFLRDLSDDKLTLETPFSSYLFNKLSRALYFIRKRVGKRKSQVFQVVDMIFELISDTMRQKYDGVIRYGQFTQ